MKKLLALIFTLFTLHSFASHIAGGQITYKCLGNNQYEVKLTYFWDCAGGFNPGTQHTLDVDGCGQSLSLTVMQSTLTPGDGVLAGGLCPTASTLTTCKKRIDYVGIITLPSACNSWSFSIGSCCRGGNITNITGGTGASYFHFATLNNTLITCNDSPDISIEQLPNFCLNQPACFNLGATELDGHTLSYAFVSAYQTASTFVTYSGTYTGTQPITGITIDPNTGQINFTPNAIGDFVITVQITEKDALGNIIGTIMRDFQVIVTNCTNQTVPCGQGAITNVSSGTVPGGSQNTLQICENIPFCFDVNFSDPDVNDSVKVSSPNMAVTLPGSTMVMTYTPGIKNQVKARICWTPPQGSSGLNTSFVLIVKDNACPVPGTQVINYFVDVLPATSAGPDQTICGPQSASVTATGSSTVFAWTDLAGAPIPVGPAFSCNPCSNPVIKPAVTSTYVVTNVGGGANCKNIDTLIINVVPDFTLTAGASVSSSCMNSAVQFTSTVNPAGPGYTYTWSPSSPLTTTNTANTSATYTTPGNYNYTVTAISSLGCVKQSNSVPFTAAPVSMPVFTVTPSNTTVCGGSSFPLDVNFGAAAPTSCGLATTGCVSPNLTQIGNGTSVNTASGYPTPYSNYFESSHMQFLYRATELTAAGISAGKLSSIGFNVSAMNSFGSPLQSFTIKIKCTSANTISTFDNAGLNQVFFASSYSPTTGWSQHNFTQAYEWDGISNILIDICYDILPGSWISGGSTAVFSTNLGTGYTVYSNADSQNQCLVTTGGTSNALRPNARFGNCLSSPNPNSFSYSWSPATGLSSTTVKSPTANISASTNYTVVVTPTAAVTCSNVGTTNLTITSAVTPTITSVVGPMCSNAATFTLTASPAGGTWSVTPGVSATGVFTPSLAAIGNNTVSYTSGGAGCQQTATMVINVERFVPSTISNTIAPQCASNPTINLTTALPTSTLGAGTWTGSGVTGTTFNPATATAGINTLTYSTNSAPVGYCPSSSTINVSVVAPITPTITPENARCNNAPSFTLVPNPTGGIWTVTPAVNALGVFNPANATIGSNTVTYTYVSGPCTRTTSTIVNIEQFVPSTITGNIAPKCSTDPVVNLATALTTSTLGTGVWAGNGVTGTTFDPAVAGAGTHTLTYSTNSSPSGLCPSTSNLAVTVNTITTPVISQAGPYCTNYASQTMTVSEPGGIWGAASPGISITSVGQLAPASSLAGIHTISYTLTSGACTATTNSTLQIVQFIPATIIGALGPYCIYEGVVNLQPIAQNAGGVWSGPGVTGTNFDPALAGAGTQTVMYSTDPAPVGLCPDFATTTILINPTPIINAVPTNATSGCNPLTINYNSTLVNTGTASWNFGDGNFGTGLPSTHTYTVPGVYLAVLSYTDNVGCVNTTVATSTVEVYEVPEAAFEATPDVASVVDANVQFTNQTSDLNNNTYEWNIGNLTSSTEVNPIYLFTNAGEYFVTLIATSPYGCQDTAIKKITITPDVVLYVPNSFTPNGDGLNDNFQIFLPPTGVDYSTFSLTVYNRWGEVIYKTNDVNSFWTGAKNNSGNILKQETYVWKISFKDEQKKYYEKVGHVTLLGK
jgi:gliding motility-associated-like protein